VRLRQILIFLYFLHETAHRMMSNRSYKKH